VQGQDDQGEIEMTSQPPLPKDNGLMPELIPLEMELEAELLDNSLLELDEDQPLDELVTEAAEAALSEDIAPLPDDLSGMEGTSEEALLETSDEVDEEAALLAAKAADIELTDVDIAGLAGQLSDLPIEPPQESDMETPSEIWEETVQNMDVETDFPEIAPLQTMGFGGPGIPLPADFNPTTYVSDQEATMEMKNISLLPVEDKVDDFEEIDTADMESGESPAWPFETDEIPEVR
jgi:hypothetical protein